MSSTDDLKASMVIVDANTDEKHFLASPDAQEVIVVTESLMVSRLY